MSNEFFEKTKVSNEEKLSIITENVELILQKDTISIHELLGFIDTMRLLLDQPTGKEDGEEDNHDVEPHA